MPSCCCLGARPNLQPSTLEVDNNHDDGGDGDDDDDDSGDDDYDNDNVKPSNVGGLCL